MIEERKTYRKNLKVIKRSGRFILWLEDEEGNIYRWYYRGSRHTKACKFLFDDSFRHMEKGGYKWEYEEEKIVFSISFFTLFIEEEEIAIDTLKNIQVVE